MLLDHKRETDGQIYSTGGKEVACMIKPQIKGFVLDNIYMNSFTFFTFFTSVKCFRDW